MARKRKRKRRQRCKKLYCAMKGKSKTRISCHTTKAAARKVIKARHAKGLKARLSERCAAKSTHFAGAKR